MTEQSYRELVKTLGLANLDVAEVFLQRTAEERELLCDNLERVFPAIPALQPVDRFFTALMIYKIRLEQKNYSQALIYCQAGIELLPLVANQLPLTDAHKRDDTIAQFYRALAHIMHKTNLISAEEVLQALTSGLGYLPNNTILREELANVYFKMELLDKAHAEFSRLIEENHQAVVPLIGRGIINIIKNAPEAAHQDLSAAQDLEPNNEAVAFCRGYLAGLIENKSPGDQRLLAEIFKHAGQSNSY